MEFFFNDLSMAFGACAIGIAALCVVCIALNCIDKLNNNCLRRFMNKLFF